jgi:hypothetical protein
MHSAPFRSLFVTVFRRNPSQMAPMRLKAAFKELATRVKFNPLNLFTSNHVAKFFLSLKILIYPLAFYSSPLTLPCTDID